MASTAGVATLSAFPPAIQKALSIPAHHRTGTIRDVEHIVILTQENRAFDQYFGTQNGVRGFADRFPIPAASSHAIQGKNVSSQPDETAGAAPAIIAPFHRNTEQRFEYMRVGGTPHSWANAQHAWRHGQMNAWPLATMGCFSKRRTTSPSSTPRPMHSRFATPITARSRVAPTRTGCSCRPV